MGLFDSEDYAPDATPVSEEQVSEINEAVTGMMSDSLMNTGGDNLESFNTESHGTSHEQESFGLDEFITAHSEDYRDVSSKSLADYQEWLFEADEASELAVARIVSNFKASGYDVKPTFATIAASTWSRANYAGEDRVTTLYNAERATVADLKPYVVEIESEGLESLIDVVRKAESQSSDYKAELLAELRAEYESESKTKITQYAKPVAIGLASVLGLSFLWRMR